MNLKKVVVIGGGTGTSTILRGLKYFPIDITAIISVADNGRSTGRLREEFSMPAMGDVRQVLSNLSFLPDDIRDIMEYRISTYSDLNGHTMGNLLLTSFYQKTGKLQTSIEYMSKLLDVKHKVLPLSEDCLTLRAETDDGEIIDGQKEIATANKKYKRISYKEAPNVLPDALKAISKANLVVISTGSLFTSILPHLACPEIVEAIQKSKAKVIYVCNAMTQPGETDGFAVSDHIRTLEEYLGKNVIDSIIVSNNILPKRLLEKYASEEKKEQVRIDYENLKDYKLVESGLLTEVDGMIRHDSLKLAEVIFHYLIA